jgi:hypothetical protein
MRDKILFFYRSYMTQIQYSVLFYLFQSQNYDGEHLHTDKILIKNNVRLTHLLSEQLTNSWRSYNSSDI